MRNVIRRSFCSSTSSPSQYPIWSEPSVIICTNQYSCQSFGLWLVSSTLLKSISSHRFSAMLSFPHNKYIINNRSSNQINDTNDIIRRRTLALIVVVQITGRISRTNSYGSFKLSAVPSNRVVDNNLCTLCTHASL